MESSEYYMQHEREYDAGEARTELAPTQGNELAKIHRMLRGRYVWLGLLGTIGGMAGAIAGIRLGHKSFQSVGTIHVMASVPKVMYSMDEKGVPPMFDSYMDAQVDLLHSQRVMDMAMSSQEWQALHREKSDSALLDFAGNLDVSHDGEMLSVRATDVDPSAAMVAVKTVIQAYQKLYDEENVQSDERRLEVLQAREATINNELDGTRREMASISKVHDTEDVSSLYDTMARNLEGLSSKITDLQVALAQYAEAQTPSANLDQLSADDIAAGGDARMVRLLNDQEMAQQKVEDLASQNVLSANPQMQGAQNALQRAQAKVNAYVANFKKVRGRMPSSPTAPAGMSAAAIRDQLKIYQDLYDKGRQELSTLADQKKRLADLQEQESIQKGELDETQHRIEQLNLEGTVTGRIEVISDGDRPLKAFRDTRITYGAGAGMFGMLLGAGLVVGLAASDRRLRAAADAEGSSAETPILGLLPELPEDLATGENARIAAHCVHEIRTMLQIWSRGKSHRVLAVTSPAAGTGKTTLSFSLGLAFASPQNRTLLIDCDLVGGGLSDRAHSLIRSRIGSVLLRQEIITPDQLEDALATAREEKRRLGDVLVEKEYATLEQVQEAADQQHDGGVGLLDYLHGMELDSCVTDTGVPGMSVLPLGAASGHHVPLLTPAMARLLLSEAREKYDTVIVDTGPTPGSLEASVVAAEADGVVVVVSKGENRPLFQKCVSHLDSIGTRIAGIVFNRASAADLSRFGSSSVGSPRTNSVSRRLREPLVEEDRPLAGRFGPLARAVSMYAPSVPASSRRRV